MTEKPSDFQMMMFDGHQYQRAKKDRKDLRGTLSFFNDTGAEIVQKVPGFPAIKRVYRLKEGIERLFGNECFWTEEKLDGYNARIFQYRGELFGATRGGFICPFTTEWARIWGREFDLYKFFRDYPGHVICGEITGDNPYNWQRDPNLPPGAHFFVFEIISPESGFLPPEKRYELIDAYGLPGVPVMGRHSSAEIQELYDILGDLNQRGREGAVFKDLDGRNRMKFVTPNSDIQDLEDTLKIGFDMDSGFFFNRYLRASLFIDEFGLDREEYARRIGQAFLNGIPGAGKFTESSEPYIIHVREKKTWEMLRDMLKASVLIKCDDIRPVELRGMHMLQVDFRRVYQKSSQKYRRILRGHLHQD